VPEHGRHLVLVGMMGAGKSTTGAALAEALGRTFVDTDALVEVEAGSPVSEVFAERGEAAFRRLEARVLEEVLATEAPAVVATGGGVVLDAANRAALAPHTVVWLRARPETLADRVVDDGSRPVLGAGGDVTSGELLERLRVLHVERALLYAEVADVVVDVDGLDRAAAAEAVRAALAGSPRSRPPASGAGAGAGAGT
jgi:shikimate kinase